MEYDFSDYEEIKEEEWPEEWPRDAKVDEAKEALLEFFDRRPEEVFYVKQLEVFFEKEFFHWITGKAIGELREDKVIGSETMPLGKGTQVRFVFNRRHRYYRRQIKERVEIIKEYSDYRTAFACGRQAEVLFLIALAWQGVCSTRGKRKRIQGQEVDKDRS